MYDLDTRKRALSLVAGGRSMNSVSKEMGISRAAIRDWKVRIEPLPSVAKRGECVRCRPVPGMPTDPEAYAYLLGLYLGDGCVSRQPRGNYSLRIACADAWPGLIDACADAIRAVRPENKVCRVQQQGCVSVTSYSIHWPCLFPQHGPGPKHGRPITLETWQQHIVGAYPWPFIRGLIHSDGCRITNWTVRPVRGVPKRYEYPRYFFTNRSADIVRLFCAALDQVGVEWKPARQNRLAKNISVAKRASVVLMDAHVGPKY
ncbi:helix-turn-helix domain-containing protein [Streptomyces sp. WMMC500]|uniref:helix-turn-helix domain-containing protein n=1 Tax=Streptomyces sp. WMMC500 TaxID=3015154 RepID=UPI00248AF4B8|nr:helix-turn-helix domain-containing protein [Streptomyces sp. WMMC500]WBB60007.1 helix-turn-helix domain-containing protein [Streptomyces sp. WMMC500]